MLGSIAWNINPSVSIFPLLDNNTILSTPPYGAKSIAVRSKSPTFITGLVRGIANVKHAFTLSPEVSAPVLIVIPLVGPVAAGENTEASSQTVIP